MASINQVASNLEKKISNWDFQKAIDHSDNESKTRDYLIEPLFNILGYNKMEHYSHEYSLQFSKGHVKKIDMVVTINGKNPIMVIECKKANANLTAKHRSQMNEYFDNQKSSKIGVLTNGVIYEFYSAKWSNKNELNETPFLKFNLTDFTRADLQDLALFHIQLFDIGNISNNAEEKYFLADFDIALAKTLYPATPELNKLIYKNMGGGRLTEKISARIHELVNSISLQEAVEQIKVNEGKNSKSGVYTTSTEINALQIVKTILAMNSKIKNENLDRVNYYDKKGFFAVVVDNMPSKEVCRFIINDYTKKLIVDGQDYLLENISAREITKFKKHIVEKATKILN
jgi:hypothetical protein